MIDLFPTVTKYQIRIGDNDLDVDIESFKKALDETPSAYIWINEGVMKLLETDRVKGAFLMAALHTPGAFR